MIKFRLSLRIVFVFLLSFDESLFILDVLAFILSNGIRPFISKLARLQSNGLDHSIIIPKSTPGLPLA